MVIIDPFHHIYGHLGHVALGERSIYMHGMGKSYIPRHIPVPFPFPPRPSPNAVLPSRGISQVPILFFCCANFIHDPSLFSTEFRYTHPSAEPCPARLSSGHVLHPLSHTAETWGSSNTVVE